MNGIDARSFNRDSAAQEVMKLCFRIFHRNWTIVLKALLLVFAGLLSLTAAEDEPSNLMVESLTFTRPEGWKWKAPPDKSNVAGFLIIPTQDKKFSTEVTFVVSVVGKEIVDRLWKGRFPDSDKPGNLHLETVRWHETDVFLFTLQGAYQIKPPKIEHLDAKLVGAIIPVGPKKFAHVRIFGPKKDVDAALGAFTAMIKEALKKE
ncbi:MAG: hypothetical protein JWM68_1923 [Verrucomicrobiales bacterium]|nr:hypothetical protein [Verrucomicrobiales bacterium]